MKQLVEGVGAGPPPPRISTHWRELAPDGLAAPVSQPHAPPEGQTIHQQDPPPAFSGRVLLRLPGHAIGTVTYLQEEEVPVVRHFDLDRPTPVLGRVADELRHRQDHVVSIDR